MSRYRARAFAPASIGNVGVGFDLLGLVIEGAGDTVTVSRSDTPGVRILAIRGSEIELPTEPENNTAGRALLSLIERAQPGFGMDVEIDKGIAYGSGMGGSAASAVAAVVAANALLDAPLDVDALYACALDGEAVASGGRHGDNVAPMLLGGLVLTVGDAPPLKLPTPAGVYSVLVHPDCVLETRRARAALATPYALHEFVTQNGHLARFLAGLYRNDLALIRAGLRDELVEPRRAALIPGFEDVKQAALAADALGASISGAGPSVFAWCLGRAAAERAGAAMRAAFAAHDLDSQIYISPLDAPGARLLED
ncbi:MAG: homoserine kinase [Aquimonas sp.]